MMSSRLCRSGLRPLLRGTDARSTHQNHCETPLAEYGRIVLGLMFGGAIASPLAGYLIRIMPQKVALWLVGIVVSSQAVISIYSLFSA